MGISNSLSRYGVLLASAALASACSLSGNVAFAQTPGDLAKVLQASQPEATLRQAAGAVDRLIGDWAVDYVDIAKDGKATRRTGRFVVRWVLDGRAVQDVWIVDPTGSRKEREIYTDVRYFDPKLRTWKAVFFDPEHDSTASFTGEIGGDGLIMHTPDLGAADSRWSFVDARADSMVFRDEASDDGGKSWRLRSEYHLTRQNSLSARP